MENLPEIFDDNAGLILAAAVFIVIVKAVGMLMKQAEKPKPAAPPVLTKDQELLAEIRDELREALRANSH